MMPSGFQLERSMETLIELYLPLALAALLAGLVDAVVGGGGLIQVPALFSALPQAAPATLFATNKLAGICGTAMAARSYYRRFAIDWRLVIPASIAAGFAAFAGAWAITIFPAELFRKLLPFVLMLVAVDVFRRKTFGTVHAPMANGPAKMARAIAVGAAVGAYDGFFGPGTGSFLVFLFVHSFGLDFLRASAAAKIVNVVCNLAALAWFIPAGQPIWALGVLMACCNISGSVLGVRLALHRGAGFVRVVFLWVVAALILKTSWDAFGPFT